MAGNVLPADFQHVAKPGGRYQGGARAFALQDHVGGDGGAVQHPRDLPGRAARLRQHVQHAGGEGLRRIGRRARGLAAPGPAALRVVQGDVGEGAADVHGDQQAGAVR